MSEFELPHFHDENESVEKMRGHIEKTENFYKLFQKLFNQE